MKERKNKNHFTASNKTRCISDRNFSSPSPSPSRLPSTFTPSTHNVFSRDFSPRMTSTRDLETCNTFSMS